MRFSRTLLALCAAALLGLAGCSGSPAASSASPDNAPADTAFTKTAADGTLLLQASARLPDAAEYASGEAAQAIADYYAAVSAAERAAWEEELSGFAAEDYEAAGQAGQAFRPYSVTGDFAVLRDDAHYLCIQRTLHSYTGGAQEEETVAFDNFYKDSGATVSLSDLFLPGSDYKAALLSLLEQELDRRIQSGQDFYYENAAGLLGSVLEDDGAFSLTGDSLVFVYPCYTLAPYSAGTQFFNIPFSALDGILRDAS